jgi:hypothetical protein
VPIHKGSAIAAGAFTLIQKLSAIG